MKMKIYKLYRNFCKWFISNGILFFLSLRYRIIMKGLDEITKDKLQHQGGILFVSTHTSRLDGVMLSALLWKKFQPAPIVGEFYYNKKGANWLFRLMKGIPIYFFTDGSNSFKVKHIQKVFTEVKRRLRKGDNISLFPSGKIKRSSVEYLGANSAFHSILSQSPNINIVLVRISGLWGSRFSWAYEEKQPNAVNVVFSGIKVFFKNLGFLLPKRTIVIEFILPKTDFPLHSERNTLNRFLEDCFNEPFLPYGEPRIITPLYFWENPTHHEYVSNKTSEMDIPHEIEKDICKKIAEITKIPSSEIHPKASLGKDLGLDSLEISGLIAYVEEKYDLNELNFDDLISVEDLIAIAARKKESTQGIFAPEKNTYYLHPNWDKLDLKKIHREKSIRSIQNALVSSLSDMSKQIACADLVDGCVSYAQLLKKILPIASAMQSLNETKVGILLPNSVSYLSSLCACILAGKSTVVLNWKAGRKNLEDLIQHEKISKIITSRAFIRRLNHVDIGDLDQRLIFLEDLNKLPFPTKLAQFTHSKILQQYLKNNHHYTENELLFFHHEDNVNENSVIKLSQHDLLNSGKDLLEKVQLAPEDIIFNALPSFHPLNPNIAGLIPFILGHRVIFSSDYRVSSKEMVKEILNSKANVVFASANLCKRIKEEGLFSPQSNIRLLVHPDSNNRNMQIFRSDG